MARFRFHLEPLLTLRRRQEDLRRSTLAGLHEARRTLEDSLRRRQHNLTHGRDALRQGLLGQIDLAMLRVEANARVQVMRQAQRSVLELAGLGKKIERASAELIEASRRRRAIEILKERRFEEWKRTVDRREQAELDELGGMTVARENQA
jgi:flagellar protein FliJ